LKNTFTAEVELIPGSHGIFDVIVDGIKIFSKDDEGRFPAPGEIVKKLA